MADAGFQMICPGGSRRPAVHLHTTKLVPSPVSSKLAHCPAINCETGGSIRPLARTQPLGIVRHCQARNDGEMSRPFDTASRILGWEAADAAAQARNCAHLHRSAHASADYSDASSPICPSFLTRDVFNILSRVAATERTSKGV
jgi:hypothetical protein